MNKILDFIRNEEDFRKFICLYKNSKFIKDFYSIKNNENIVYSKNIFLYNSCIYNFKKNDIEKFITYLKHNTNIIEKKGEGYESYIEIKINEIEVYPYIKQYEKKLFEKYNFNDEVMVYSKSLGATCRKTSSAERFFVKEYKKVYITNNIKEILNNLEEKYRNVYKIIKLLSQRLEEKEWINIGSSSISSILDISEGNIKKILDYLIEIGLIVKRKVMRGKGFYYEYKAMDFIESIINKEIEVINNEDNHNVINKNLKNIPNMFYVIYEITDLTNGMKYIGKHKTYNLNDGYMGSGRLLKQNQEIKGIENFTKKILHLCKNEQHMDEMERMEIEKVKAYENNMYYNLI